MATIEGEFPDNEWEDERRKDKKQISFLKRMLIGLAAVYVATTGVAIGDATDPFGWGRDQAASASQSEQREQPAYLVNAGEHESAQAAANSSDDSDVPVPSCVEKIGEDLRPERPLAIEHVADALESIVNVHIEHYVAVTATQRFTYLCTVTLAPYDVTIQRTGATGRAGVVSRNQTQPRS
jgi:hypothetical protein